MKQTVEFKDSNDQYFTLLTSTIKSVSQIGRLTYLNLFDKESIEISTDYNRAREILDEALNPPTEYYVIDIKGQVHYIPVLQVRNLIDRKFGLLVYLQDGTEYNLATTADKFLATKTAIKG